MISHAGYRQTCIHKSKRKHYGTGKNIKMQYSHLYTSPLLPAYMHLHSLVDPFRKNVKFYFILPCKKFGK